jgi:hypothetical protein
MNIPTYFVWGIFFYINNYKYDDVMTSLEVIFVYVVIMCAGVNYVQKGITKLQNYWYELTVLDTLNI